MRQALAEAEAKAMAEPGALTAALNWYRAVPLSRSRDTGKKVTVPTMYRLERRRHRPCGRRVLDRRRLCAWRVPLRGLKGVSHWILDEQPDKTADLLLDWFAAHPAEP